MSKEISRKTEETVTIEKKLFRPSISEMALLAVALLILLNGLVFFLFTFLLKNTYPEVFKKAWIILIFTPLLTGIAQGITNRPGLLMLKGLKHPPEMQSKLAEMLKYFDYQETDRDDQSLYLDYRTKWKRFMNLNNGRVSLTIDQDEIMISGKKAILDFIELKMMLGKDFKDLRVHKVK